MSQNSENKGNLKRRAIVAGLDIGTTKVAFIIGAITDGDIEVIGVGECANTGMKHGVVVNIDAVTHSISKAKEEAELMAGLSVDRVKLAIGGSHISSFDSNGMVAIRNTEVTNEDIQRVIDAAKAVLIPNDRQVLHVLPKNYKIDGQEGISDPLGMSGVRLEANVHIVTGKTSAIQNSIRCVENAGLKVTGIVLQQLATSLAVLSDDERSLGVTLVDIGGGTSDLISFSGGSVIHTGMIPVGGINFSHDVAMGLRTTQNNAEVIKKKFGCAMADTVSPEDLVEIESVGGRPDRNISRKELCEILEARTEETLKLIQKELKEHKLMGNLGSGVVMTGGSSQLSQLVELGDFIFDIPVRLGVPQRLGGLTDVVKGAEYATVVGLLLHAHQEQLKSGINKKAMNENHNLVSDWAKKLKHFFGLPI